MEEKKEPDDEVKLPPNKQAILIKVPNELIRFSSPDWMLDENMNVV